jgi:hypothetical protein
LTDHDKLIESMFDGIVETSVGADGTVKVKFSTALRRRPPCGSQ